MARLSKGREARKAEASKSTPDRVCEILLELLNELPNDLQDKAYKHDDGAGYSKWGFVMASVMKKALMLAGVPFDDATGRAMVAEVIAYFTGQDADDDELLLLLQAAWNVCILPADTYPDEYTLHLVRTGAFPMLDVDRGAYPSPKVAEDAALLLSWLHAFGLWRAEHPHGRNECAYLATRRIETILGKSHTYWAAIYHLLLDEGALIVQHPARVNRPTIYRVIANVSERRANPVYKGLKGLKNLKGLEVTEGLKGFEGARSGLKVKGARRNPTASGGGSSSTPKVKPEPQPLPENVAVDVSTFPAKPTPPVVLNPQVQVKRAEPLPAQHDLNLLSDDVLAERLARANADKDMLAFHLYAIEDDKRRRAKAQGGSHG